MQVNPTMLSEDMWLPKLAESRNRVLDAAESGRLDLSAVNKLANAESLLAIALEPVPADPLTHVRDAHTRARTYLAHFASGNIPERVQTGLGYTMTPRKALRRVLDHALDHLDQIEQWLTWQRIGTVPVASDGWVGSAVTLNDDTAPLSAQELEAWVWRIDVAVHLLIRRAAQLSRDELDWQPPDGAWTLRHVMHHVASGAVLYCRWFENVLPDAPVERYRQANRRLVAALERVITTPSQSGSTLFDDDLGFFIPDVAVAKVLELEHRT